MSPTDIRNVLAENQLITPQQRDQLAAVDARRPFSVHYELRVLLYAGVLLLSAGLGLLIYDNYERLGRGVVLAGITALCLTSFAFAWRYRPPWRTGQTRSESAFGEYALLLGCLLFLSLEGYAQYAYNVFGERYGLVTFVPAVLFLALAYRFDHRGVLGMALTALVSWVGVTVRPLELRLRTNFFDFGTVLSALALAAVLIGGAFWLQRQRIKAHFTYTYLLVAGNLLLVALLAGLFNFERYVVAFAAGLAAACVGLERYARQTGSFLFALMAAIYGYIGLTYLLFHYVDLGVYGVVTYFLVTGTALTIFLLSYHRRQRQTA